MEINPDGLVSWFPTGRLTTQCDLNLRFFPFDTQICDLHLESWTYPVEELEIIPADNETAFWPVKKGWVENSVWMIAGNATITGRQKWPDGWCYPFIIYRLILKRKPLYEIIYIILPSLIIGAAETVVFFLPCDDPTRVQISVTCLLAYTFFQSIIIKSIPKSIDSVPLLSLFIDLQMVYISLIAIIGDAIVFSITNSNFHPEAPSRKLIKIALSLGRSLGIKKKHISRNLTLDVFGQDFKNMSLDSDTKLIKETLEHWRCYTSKKMIKKEWLFIGQVVQRLLFIIYSILYISTPMILLITSYVLDEDHHLKNYDTDC